MGEPQTTMDPAPHIERARAYGALARLFRRPGRSPARPLAADLEELAAALRRLPTPPDLGRRAERLGEAVGAIDVGTLAGEWDHNFEPAGGLVCAPNETVHTAHTSPEAWLKTYRQADIAGFYRAFGVEIEPGTEQCDHIAVELEFMHLLAVKSAVAHEDRDAEAAAITAQAEAAFLADHLGRWCGDIVRCLREGGMAPNYLHAAEILADFVAWHGACAGPPPAPRRATDPAERLRAMAGDTPRDPGRDERLD